MCVKSVVLFSLVLMSVRASLGWSVNSNSVYKTKSILPSPDGKFPHLMESIANGIQMALDHCQTAFKWDRWNCPQSTFTRPSRQPPNKETAYTKAIIAAGIVHAITKNCSRGEIKDCGCDPNLSVQSFSPNFPPEPKKTHMETKDEQATVWSWGGCFDDPSYALDVAKTFLDGMENGSDATGYVSRHNGKVGREIIPDTMVKRCRCHGVSGSCSLRTCWMQLAPFEVISRKLRLKYRNSVRVTREVIEKSIIVGNSARDTTEDREIPGIDKDLLFLVQSPDYCLPNPAEDYVGTKGRTCSRNRQVDVSTSEKKSCRNICRHCGYKVKKIKTKVRKQCNCKFVWCCDVQCDTCEETVEEHFCK